MARKCILAWLIMETVCMVRMHACIAGECILAIAENANWHGEDAC